MSTSLDLTSYVAVQQATFVKMTTTENGAPVIVRASTHSVPFSITESDGNVALYPAVGTLLGVSGVTSDMKASAGDISVTFSGIPTDAVATIINNPIKGSPIEVRRAFFNPTTGNLISTPGNPTLEFSGIVNNFTIEEGWTDGFAKSVTTTISLSCSSLMSVLSRKVSGRRTNNDDQNYWFPGDKSMSRVAIISDAVFDFGGTSTSTTSAAATQSVKTNSISE